MWIEQSDSNIGELLREIRSLGFPVKPRRRKPAQVKGSDISRCIRACRAQGLNPTGTILRPDGTVVLTFGTSGEATPLGRSEWDEDLGT